MRVHIEAKGLPGVAMLQHNKRMATPLDPFTVRLNEIIREKKASERTLEDHANIARAEWEGGLYYSGDIGPYVPGEWIEACLKAAGGLSRDGKKIERSLFVEENQIPLLYPDPKDPTKPGPRDLDGMYAQSERFVLTVSARNKGGGGGRIDRTRPMFYDWELSTVAELDTSILNLKDLNRIGEVAGRFMGLGDWRPRYGRFDFHAEVA